MLDIFTKIADWCIEKLNVSLDTHFGQALHFFIEDTTKIFFLIYALIFIISLFRAQLSPERIKVYLVDKSRFYGYILAVFLGVVTPFCSCSSIPIFMGLIAARIPFGVAIAFLVSSPLISEIAAIMLVGMGGDGIFIASIYILTGTIISVLAGYLSDRFNLERYLVYKPNIVEIDKSTSNKISEKIKILIKYSHNFAFDTLKSISIYILIGLLIGAIMHGYVPEEIFLKYLGKENMLAVPFAAIIGAPLYASHAGVVPIVQVLLSKGVPIGTSLVVLMSITAISLPEMIMLKKVFSIKLLFIFIIFLIVAFIVTGYLLNLL